MKQGLMLSTLVVTLAGCGTVSDLPRGYALGAGDDEGLAVVSLTLSGKSLERVSSFEYRVREAAVDAAGEVKRRPYFHSARQHARWLQDKDAQGPAAMRMKLVVKDQALSEPLDVVESGTTIGRLATLRLPAGDYELYDWRVVVPNQYGGDVFSPRPAMAYRFRVEAGRATYLGNLNLRITDQDRYDVTVANKADRDLVLLAKKLPSVSAREIIHRPGELRP